MQAPAAEQIHAMLAASREGADRTLAKAERRAAELSGEAAAADRALAAARLARLAELRRQIEERRGRIEGAQVSLVEAMATGSAKLAELARYADFSPPRWPEGLGRTLEVKLSQTRRVVSETREVTLRLPTASGDERRT